MVRRAGQFVTETFAYDGGRQTTVYVPSDPPEAIVFAADGNWHTQRLVEALEKDDLPPTMLVGVHGLPDDEARLKEYVPIVDAERFAAHETFFVEDVRARFGLALPPARTAVWGASLGAELALAVALRHPDVFGAVFAASPGRGYRPPQPMPARLPRAYLVAGTQEPFFLANATRWADALKRVNAGVILTERDGAHGGAFWYAEFPLMLRWFFWEDERDPRQSS